MRSLHLTAALLLASFTALAQRQMTVSQLVIFIKSSVQMKNDDRQVAEFVRKVKLSNKLEPRTVEDLQGAGVGPKTIAALKELVTSTAALTPPPPAAPKEAPAVAATLAPPDSIEQKKILAEITQKALDYNKTLPNFICTQVTRRHADTTGHENWRLLDTIQERLSYFDHKEDYKVTLVNGQMVNNVDHDKLGGATSSGEFGSMLADIFEPETSTEFEWERWATLRTRRMYVFGFKVEQKNSKYSILHVPSSRRIVTGYHGLIYADAQTKQVMRVKFDADGIPLDFPIQNVSMDLNYDFTTISDQPFVLPLKAELRSTEGRYHVWNEVEFHLYRMFGADTSITFDPVGAIPDDQIQEQPAQPQIPPAKSQ